TWSADWGFPFDVQKIDPTGKIPPEKLENRTLQQFLRYAFQTKGDGKTFGGVEPVGDPEPVTINGELSDERVQTPSESAFDAAVRGASEQFTAAPYFKMDLGSNYDSNLYAAFRKDTSVYAESGRMGDTPSVDVAARQAAIQLRGSVLQAIVRDFQR